MPQGYQLPPKERLVQAYDLMMERVGGAFHKAEQDALPGLQHNIEIAKEKAVELGELTREEADKIAAYLRRDIHDAAEYLADTGEELSQWLRFDIELIEQRLWELFSQVADKTRLELLQLQERAKAASEYHTGEVTGPGALQCVGCGNLLYIKASAHIPPCAKCRGTVYQRQSG